jgi:colanic acid biosynthesis glycosyl transferase WcaI
MRIIINDFGGYPFPIQLSKQLASQGYDVIHTYVSNIATPHGNMEDKDNEKLLVMPVVLDTAFKKYSVTGRIKGEYNFANKLIAVIKKYKPTVFISANTPLIAQRMLLKACKRQNIKFIYWCQDIHSIAIKEYLQKKLPFIGSLIAAYIKKQEINLLMNSDHVITIAQSFNDIFESWGIHKNQLSVIQNWAPIDEINVEPKINPWSLELGLADKTVILYSGTLGVKHNPQIIADAANHFKHNTDIVFVVISEGLGAGMLSQQGLKNLIVLPYQEYKLLPKVLGTADILLSILEPNAAIFSVPSKVLTYLCAGKSILLSVPKDNLTAHIVITENAGLCVEPGDFVAFIASLTLLINSSSLRMQMGRNGRRYAGKNFPILPIADRFIKIINMVLSPSKQ